MLSQCVGLLVVVYTYACVVLVCQNVLTGYKVRVVQIQRMVKELYPVTVQSDPAPVFGKQFEMFPRSWRDSSQRETAHE